MGLKLKCGGGYGSETTPCFLSLGRTFLRTLPSCLSPLSCLPAAAFLPFIHISCPPVIRSIDNWYLSGGIHTILDRRTNQGPSSQCGQGSLSNEVTFEQRPEGSEGASFVVAGRTFQGKVPVAGAWQLRKNKCSWGGVNQCDWQNIA